MIVDVGLAGEYDASMPITAATSGGTAMIGTNTTTVKRLLELPKDHGHYERSNVVIGLLDRPPAHVVKPVQVTSLDGLSAAALGITIVTVETLSAAKLASSRFAL